MFLTTKALGHYLNLDCYTETLWRTKGLQTVFHYSQNKLKSKLSSEHRAADVNMSALVVTLDPCSSSSPPVNQHTVSGTAWCSQTVVFFWRYTYKTPLCSSVKTTFNLSGSEMSVELVFMTSCFIIHQKTLIWHLPFWKRVTGHLDQKEWPISLNCFNIKKQFDLMIPRNFIHVIF